TEFKKVDFTQENWVEKFCDNIANIEGESAWFERLDQLTATEQRREDNLEAIFDHFFNTEVTRYDNEYILTSTGIANYHNLLNLGILDEDKFALFKEPFGIDGRKVSKHMKQQFTALFKKYRDKVKTDCAFYELPIYHLHIINNKKNKIYSRVKIQKNILSNNYKLKITNDM